MSIEIVVKSSRRPWALDRLLSSLDQYLSSDHAITITVVDDRTDARYKRAIQDRHPKVVFGENSTWENYRARRSTLPYVRAWQNAISAGNSRYVLVLEDDQWLTKNLNLDEVEIFMQREGSLSLHLAQDKEEFHDVLFFESSNENFFFYLPRALDDIRGQRKWPLLVLIKLATSPKWLPRKLSGVMTLLFPKLMRPLWRSLASSNPMAGAVFEREYWLNLWGGRITWINENIQISRAIRISRGTQNSKVAWASLESGKAFSTTFLSSMSLTLGTGVDWGQINESLSEAWLKNVLQMPRDESEWDKEHLATLIEGSLGSAMRTEYEDWCARFAKLHSL